MARQMQDVFWDIASNDRRRAKDHGAPVYTKLGRPVRLHRDHKASVFAAQPVVRTGRSVTLAKYRQRLQGLNVT